MAHSASVTRRTSAGQLGDVPLEQPGALGRFPGLVGSGPQAQVRGVQAVGVQLGEGAGGPADDC